ncbi:unnamed protein product [Chironomus riparius]|uniref:F-box domain-containing protein n=1 Tax=Chironomus riparius TaxID=315576 RepID=A0A9N9WYR3_9DIPT|nr:unnamed protein product [Chironomus riparius]
MNESKVLVLENSKRIKFSDENQDEQNKSDEAQEFSNIKEDVQPNTDEHSPETTQEDDATSFTFPIEIILKIISYLNDKEDLFNSFCLSKEIYICMYKSPDIMRNIVYKLNCGDDEKFLKYRGKFIRRLVLACFKEDRKFFLPSLNYTPNVEDLTLDDLRKSRRSLYYVETATDWESGTDDGSVLTLSDDESDNQEFIDQEYRNIRVNSYINLNKLQSLTITNVFRESIKSLRVENLVKLSVTFEYGYNTFVIFVDFFCELKHLKELIFNGYIKFPFPNRDYKKTALCKLRKIHMSFCSNLKNNKNFGRFLEAQATEVEEMNLGLNLNEDIFDTIFMKFAKLRRLTLSFSESYNFLSSDHPEWELPTLKYYKQSYGTTINLLNLANKFPNLKTFVGSSNLSVNLENFGHKFLDLNVEGIAKLINGQFLTILLSSIDVKLLDLNELKSASFPNLICLKADTIIGFNKDDWKDFTIGLKSLEHVSFKNLDNRSIEDMPLPSFISIIFMHLKDIKTLKTVRLSFNNETITIDLAQKSVKYSWSLDYDCSYLKDVLNIFTDFELLECKN